MIGGKGSTAAAICCAAGGTPTFLGLFFGNIDCVQKNKAMATLLLINFLRVTFVAVCECIFYNPGVCAIMQEWDVFCGF
jgi:hypothetical protein